jgi:tetrahydromethanopterin S-methyltransferase subunit F
VNIVSINLSNNALDQAAVDSILEDIYNSRSQFQAQNKSLNLGGSNAAPSATGLGWVADLNANHGWSITCNGC